MNSRHAHQRHEERGQSLVLMALALVALLAMTGLIVDGGNAWAQQRASQNASDSSAEAGTVILVQRLSGATAPSSSYATGCPTAPADQWDRAVCNAVYGAAANNSVSVNSAKYTNFDGSLLLADVGAGSVPAGAQGVRTIGTRQFSTYLAGVVGITKLEAATEGTAVLGAITTFCPQGQSCQVLPVTFPVNVSSCAGNGSLTPGSGPWPYVGTNAMTAANEAIVPLCKNGPGSVGWLDWPCNAVNGTPGLVDEITNSCVRSLTLPEWIGTSDGNPNTGGVEDAINALATKQLLLPQFDDVRGTGSGLQYHVVQLFGFVLDHAYLAGNNHPECNLPPGQPFVDGNGSNGCLKGWWTQPILTGEVQLGVVPPGTDTKVGISLIK